MNFGIIVQARTGSKRFPKKILARINDDQNVLEYQIYRILNVFSKKNLLIATTKLKEDRVILDIAKKHKIILRVLRSYGLKNYIRVTIGTAQEMQIAMKVFNKF